MVLIVPRFMQVVGVQETTVRYRWDDWNVEQAEEPIDEEFYKRLVGISQRATVALTIGTAEWILHRFGNLSDDALPHQYLEAGWAEMVDERYVGFTWEDYTDEKQWTGPIRGPVGVAMTRVMYALQQTEQSEDPELRAAWISNLAQYIMTDPAPYQRWRERIMERLQTLYPRNPEDTLGDVVPREALDPDLDFTIEQTESLLNQFLARLDNRSNPFLNSPENMLEQGFHGTPYVFNIAEDRKVRFEW